MVHISVLVRLVTLLLPTDDENGLEKGSGRRSVSDVVLRRCRNVLPQAKCEPLEQGVQEHDERPLYQFLIIRSEHDMRRDRFNNFLYTECSLLGEDVYVVFPL